MVQPAVLSGPSLFSRSSSVSLALFASDACNVDVSIYACLQLIIKGALM